MLIALSCVFNETDKVWRSESLVPHIRARVEIVGDFIESSVAPDAISGQPRLL